MKRKRIFAACITGAVIASIGSASAQDPATPAPVVPVPPAVEPAPAPSHTVASGDSLWKISAALLGSGDRWLELFAINQDVLDDPDQIEAGQVLKVPTSPVAIPPDLLAEVSPAPATNRSAAARSTSGGSSSDAAPSRTSGGGGGGDAHMAAIRQCESGGNYQAVSGQYRGAYQFDQQTWESVGGSGDPAAASPSEQDARAQALRSQRGSNPWPNCG